MKRMSVPLEVGAGVSAGSFLGLLMGLSASPVVTMVLGGLSAALTAFLGLSKAGPDADSSSDSARGSALRVLGFGLSCGFFLMTGIYVRTHGVLAPSVASQEQALKSVEAFDAVEKKQLLLYQAYGLTEQKPLESNLVKAEPSKSLAGSTAGLLFSSKGDICSILRRSQYGTVAEYLHGLDVHGGPYADLANAVKQIPKPQEQDRLAEAMSKILCE